MEEFKLKFKIGDLVRVAEIAFLLDEGMDVKVGDIGIIVSMDPYDHELITLWGIDYMVMLGDKKILFFENELELVKKVD